MKLSNAQASNLSFFNQVSRNAVAYMIECIDVWTGTATFYPRASAGLLFPDWLLPAAARLFLQVES